MLESAPGRSGWRQRPVQRWLYTAVSCLAIIATLGIITSFTVDEPVATFRGKFQSHQEPDSKRPTPPVPSALSESSLSVEEDGLEDVLGPLRKYDEGFTIVSPTYHRTDSLSEFLDNYAKGEIPSLKRILMIWNNEEDPPASLNATIAKYPVPVTLERREKNSKNERFRRTSSITTAAVFALDDDMVIIPRDMEYAFQAWRTYHHPRTRMVGFIRRREEDGHYRIAPSNDGYSMVLTKSAFIHVDWMDLWWADSKIMQDFRDYVEARKLPEEFPDLRTGCEDIAMSFLYAHHTRVPPLWVAGSSFHDTGHSKLDGISTQPGHNQARTACVQHFREVFGNDTLINTQIHATLLEPTEGHWDSHGE